MTILNSTSEPVKLCNPKLKEAPWNFDAPLPPHYGPGSSQDDVIPAKAPVSTHCHPFTARLLMLSSWIESSGQNKLSAIGW